VSNAEVIKDLKKARDGGAMLSQAEKLAISMFDTNVSLKAALDLPKKEIPVLTDKVDPWEHRSDGMRCRTCMWAVMKTETKKGRCRRHAPTMSGYPVVFDIDFCGDHKLA